MRIDTLRRICAVMALACLAQPAFAQPSPADRIDPLIAEDNAREERRALPDRQADTAVSPACLLYTSPSPRD